MEGGRATEQDFDEFDLLLGEIPKATLVNQHAPHPISVGTSSAMNTILKVETNKMSPSSRKFTNMYDSTQSVKNGESMIFSEHQSNGELDRSNLPDDKSLASAFEELSFKDSVAPVSFKDSVAPETTRISLNHSFLNNSQSLFGIDTSGISAPPLHQALNGDKMDSRCNVNLPRYDGAMPFNPRAYACQLLPKVPVAGMEFTTPPLLPKVPVAGMEFTTPPYQQPLLLDAQAPTLMPPHHLDQLNMAWPGLEEERHYRLHQQYLYQQLHNHKPNVLQFQKTFSGSQVQPYYEMIPSHQNVYLNDNVVHNGFTRFDLSAMSNGLLQYHPQGSYGRAEGSEFPHRHQLWTADNFSEHQILDRIGKQHCPVKILTRSHGVNSVRPLRSNSFLPNQSSPFAYNDSQNSCSSSPDSIHLIHKVKYNFVDEVKGRIYSLAKDQHGCRFLQQKFTEGSLDDVNKIFVEIIDHVVELMTDPFGNYLMQKILEVCTDDKRVQIIHAITREDGLLIRISCNMHGTRAVQKVIETLQTNEQIIMVVSSLKPCIVSLIKDINGNHVAQRCLQYFSPQQNEFIFDAAISHCVEIATDRQGCCVLQKCVHHSYGDQRNKLISEICSYSLVLSQDPFGNYVVQCVLDQNVPWALAAVLDQLDGNFGHLSMQKHSSNVVERCLKLAKEEDCIKIIRELINSSLFLQILQDAYGNYVIQSALRQCKGPLNAALVEAIKSHAPMLQSHPYGKKVLSGISSKK